MEGWTANEADKLRELLGWKPEVYARRLKIHKRTVLRWRDAQTHPAPALWEDLDNLLLEAARKLAPWLSLDQLTKMQRRDLLKLLAASASVPLGGIDLLWNTAFSNVSNTSLSSLEEITTLLAAKCNTSPPDALLGSAVGHLEKASALLRNATMHPTQRQRLESIVADGAIFVGVLSEETGKLVQAGAHFDFAERLARQAGNMVLLAQALAEQAVLHYYERSPNKPNMNARPSVELLEQAQSLATRYGPSIVQMGINGWLAEDRAAVQDGYGADEALELASHALEKTTLEGATGTGFVSSTGTYSVCDAGWLAGYRGTVELTLKRPTAVSTIEMSLQLKENPRKRATGLADLAKAFIAAGQPDEACACLTEAHTIGLSQGSVLIMHHVFSARVLMPPAWNSLRCVRELDERLRVGS